MNTRPDRLLRRFELDALAATLVPAGAAAIWPGFGPRAAAAVLAGAALIWFSYLTIRTVIDGALRRRARAIWLVKIFTRHGILAVAAYVILVRLQLHPIGVLVGASSFVIAAGAAVVRSFLAAPGRVD